MYNGTLNKNFVMLGDFNTTNQQGIIAAQQSIAYWQDEYNRTQTQTALTQLNYWKAQLQALQTAANKGAAYIATHPGSIQQWFNQYFNQLNLQTYPGQNLPNIYEPDSGNFFSADLAGMPVWAWVLIIGAGVFLLWDNKKRK